MMSFLSPDTSIFSKLKKEDTKREQKVPSGQETNANGREMPTWIAGAESKPKLSDLAKRCRSLTYCRID